MVGEAELITKVKEHEVEDVQVKSIEEVNEATDKSNTRRCTIF